LESITDLIWSLTRSCGDSASTLVVECVSVPFSLIRLRRYKGEVTNNHIAPQALPCVCERINRLNPLTCPCMHRVQRRAAVPDRCRANTMRPGRRPLLWHLPAQRRTHHTIHCAVRGLNAWCHRNLPWMIVRQPKLATLLQINHKLINQK
jgi:hypothetical protein